MKRINLNGEYRLYPFAHSDAPERPEALRGEGIPATVPGNAELDLQRAGLLPDVLSGTNARKAKALEMQDFWYVRRFSLTELPPRVQLCFDGVDTLAEIFLNGVKLGRSENMLIGCRFPADGILRCGENELAVHIFSAVAWAKTQDIQPYNVAFPGCYESLHLRKSAMNYGWDISPRLVSAGIWKDVYLESRSATALREVYLATASVYDDVAVLVLSCNADMADEYLGTCTLRINGVCGDSRFSADYPMPHCAATVYPYVPQPKLWQPLGMGEQNLYDVTVQLLCGGRTLAERRLRFGIRTVHLEFGEATGQNGQFCLYVNHKRLRCKGVNWVPLSLLHSQDSALCAQTVRALRDCGCNTVRVWGGGVYESEEFFELCDEYGILVWQDMMLSCHAYPMTDAFSDAIAAECEAVAKRIRNHACLAFYCGGNETDWSYVCVGLDPNDDRITRSTMKTTLWQNDPYRQFLPSTPYFSREFIREHGGRFYLDLDEIKRERTSLPDEHYWWHREDFLNVREQTHKFISEIGYSGASPRSSIDRYLPAGWTFGDDAAWEDHSYPTEGNRAIGINYLFENAPQDENGKLLASQLYQAEAYKFVVELCRSREENNGILLWTLRENWPSFSSALVDYYGVRKPAFDAVRASYAPLQCVIDVEDGIAKCYLVNDRLDARHVFVRITDENGTERFSAQVRTQENRAVTELAELPVREQTLLLTELRNKTRTVRNYRYVYTQKIDFPTYQSLWNKKIRPILTENGEDNAG